MKFEQAISTIIELNEEFKAVEILMACIKGNINKIEKEKMRITSLNELLKAHNPINVLNKGFVIVQDKDENIISSKKALGDIDEVNIIFKDGKVKGKIIKDI